MATIVQRDDVYVLNYCTKSLARDNTDGRHNYRQYVNSSTKTTWTCATYRKQSDRI